MQPIITLEYHGDSTVLGEYSAKSAPEVMAEGLPPNYVVKNEGMNSSTIRKLLNGTDGVHPEWRKWMAQSTATYVILNHGLNDVHEPGNTPAIYKAHYAQAVDIAQAAGKTVILETPNPSADEPDGLRDSYRAALLELAAERKLPLIDQHKYLVDYVNTNGISFRDLLLDLLHPNQYTLSLKGRYAASRFKEIVGIN